MKYRGMLGLTTSALLGFALVARAEPHKPPGPPGEHMGPPGEHTGPPGDHMGPPGGHMGHGPGPGPSGSAAGRGWDAKKNQGDQGDLAEQFRHHRPKPDEAAAKLGELRSTFAARRQAHRERMRAEFGPGALRHPEVFAELRKHARRMAFLNRAKLVATTELDEPKRTATLGRIDKLLASEQARHQTAIQKLKAATPPSPSASAVASAVPAPAVPAPAGSTP